MNPNIIILTTTEVLEGLASGKYLDLEVRKLEDAARSTVIQLDNVIDGQQIQVLNAYEQLKSRGMEELDLAGLHKFHYHHNAGATTVIHETNGTISITDFDGRVLFNAGSTVFGRIPELSEMRVLSDWEFDPDDFAAASYYEDEQPALATFEKFPEFPQEIKNKVWEIAGRNCEGREITLDEITPNNWHLQGSPKPILLHAASEIEKDLVVTKVYQQLNLQNTAKKVFFKADIDTLHVISSSQLSGHLAPLSTPAFSTGMDLAKVRHLTFNLTVFQDNFNEALQIINSVDSLESLKIQGYVWAVQDALVWVQFRDVNLDGQVIVPLYQTTHNQLQGQNAIDHIGRALQIQGEQDRLEELWAIMTHVGQHTTNLPQYVDLEIQYGA